MSKNQRIILLVVLTASQGCTPRTEMEVADGGARGHAALPEADVQERDPADSSWEEDSAPPELPDPDGGLDASEEDVPNTEPDADSDQGSGAENSCALLAGSPCTLHLDGEVTQGVIVCILGKPSCGLPGCRLAGEERCNGQDDDCDGLVDEELDHCCWPPGSIRRVEADYPDGVGLCRSGHHECLGEEGWGPLVGAIRPGPERCNGLDDDCDGSVDEIGDLYPDEERSRCDTGQPGLCAEGLRTCLDGRERCLPLRTPSPEACDGLDNDCNGLVDDIAGAASQCDTGLPGVCAGGTLVCTHDGPACLPRAEPAGEVCNGLDDDCNGDIDDLPPEADGDGDGFVCDDCDGGRPEVHPGAAEVCDGMDNDCDGEVDEGADLLGEEVPLTGREQGHLQPVVVPAGEGAMALLTHGQGVELARFDPEGGQLLEELHIVSRGLRADVAQLPGGHGYLLAVDLLGHIELHHLDSQGEPGVGGSRSLPSAARPQWPRVTACGEGAFLALSDAAGLWLISLDLQGNENGARLLIDEDPVAEQAPALACSGSRVAVAWVSAEDEEIHLRSVDAHGGQAPGPDRVLSSSPGALQPAIHWTGRYLAAAWIERTGRRPDASTGDLVVSLHTEAGEVLRPESVLVHGGLASRPHVAGSGEDLAVAFLDRRAGESDRVSLLHYPALRPQAVSAPLLVTPGEGRSFAAWVIPLGEGRHALIYDDQREGDPTRVFLRRVTVCAGER